MATIENIDEFMEIIAPHKNSESWDNDGVMFCDNINKEITKVLISLDVTENAINKALENKVQLIITHHPLIFKPLYSITKNHYNLFKTLYKNDISILSYHTRLDCAENGVNFTLAEKMGLENIRSFGGENNSLCRFGELSREFEISEFAEKIKSALNVPILRAAFPKNKKIKTVGICGGAGKDFVHAAASAGCDAFLSSEIPHNILLEATFLNIALFDAGHYYTENIICKKLKTILEKSFNDVEFIVFNDVCSYIDM